jgi:pSer/pThr/pTyr-binding forkhead associated (FHA) protein
LVSEAAIGAPRGPSSSAPPQPPLELELDGLVGSEPTARRASASTESPSDIDAVVPRPSVAEPRLVVIVEDGSEGRAYPLGGTQVDIGRTEGDIRLEDDPYVSPRHARIRRIEETWYVRDLDSTNRVFIRLRKPYTLHDGDLLLLGLEVLQFHAVSDGERGHGHALQHGTLLFGSPATPARARLCQRTVEGVIRDVYHVFRDETVIGREAGDLVFTADPFLSRKHAAIRRNPVTSEFSVADLDSSNGTYVALRSEVAVTSGDFLRIGQHLFRVDLG